MDGPIAQMRSRRQATSVVAIGGGLLLFLLLLVATGNNPFDDKPAALGEDIAVGNEDNTDPVFETVQNWRDLVGAVESQGAEWYKQCMSDRIGVTWEQAQRYAELVDQGHDLRFILVSNTSISDEQAREGLRGDGITDVDNLPIKRVDGFRNTRGLPTDKCQAFGDDRKQVRVSLAIPIDHSDMSKGVHQEKGVLAMCSNPWDLAPPPDTAPPESRPPPPSETTATTKPPTTVTTEPPDTTTTTKPRVTTTTRPTTTTTRCTTKGCTGATVTTVAPPPTTAPSGTTPTTQPSNGGQRDSGDGATTNTTSSPTTSTTAASSPPTTTPVGTLPPPPPG